MDIFAYACKNQLSFPSPVGQLNAYDLWDLPLTARKSGNPDLDKTAKAIYNELKSLEEESFVSTNTASPRKKQLEVALEVVKYVIQDKLAAAEKAKQARANADRRAKLTDILAQKQDQALMDMSEDDILKELETVS